MFEPKEKSDSQSSQTPHAFMQGLPTFSLPANLNNKLAANKKNGQQLNRPRLSNLRSAWLSKHIKEDIFADDKLIEINLPTISTSTNVIQNEMDWLNVIATSLCLVSSILLCLFSTSNQKLNSIWVGQWVLLFIWYKLGRTELGLQVKSFLASSIFMLVMTTLLSYHENGILVFSINQLPALLGTLIYTCLFRFIEIDKVLQQEVEQQHERYQQESQHIIDEALKTYDDKRQLFLTTVSKEIRDASLMVMATLEQFSPPSILTNTHELLSACSIAVPIASISAINTTIKQACHVSSHLNLISKMLREADDTTVILPEDRIKSDVKHDFDVSEMIQNVGDALAGMSAKLGVHFVIYHTDNGLYYSNVIGDEDAIKHALINVQCVTN